METERPQNPSVETIRLAICQALDAHGLSLANSSPEEIQRVLDPVVDELESSGLIFDSFDLAAAILNL
jgi:hypothetical protein